MVGRLFYQGNVNPHISKCIILRPEAFETMCSSWIGMGYMYLRECVHVYVLCVLCVLYGYVCCVLFALYVFMLCVPSPTDYGDMIVLSCTCTVPCFVYG